MRVLAVIALLVALAWPARPAAAHESMPLVIVMTETGDDLFSLRVETPPALRGYGRLQLAPPASCEGVAQSSRDGSGFLRCTRDPGGGRIGLTMPTGAPAVPVLLRFTRATGETHTILAEPGADHVALPERTERMRVARQYFALGAEHLFAGVDHVLFLLCLLWIAGNLRRTIMAVTGFTLAHSLTLALSVLSVVRVPTTPVEATIALSIVFLAVEIAKNRREGIAWRHPVVVATIFGLLHGLGFASVLTDLGLPQTERVVALLAFNLGVEAAQVALVCIAFAALAAMRRLMADREFYAERFRAAVLLAVGGIASFWLIERTAAML